MNFGRRRGVPMRDMTRTLRGWSHDRRRPPARPAGDEEAFRELTDPYRRELQVHCYRILGSVQDAEDLVQETLLAAWRGLDGFEERASVRTWLYRIATNRCLNALRDSGRRPEAMKGLTAGRRCPSRPGWASRSGSAVPGRAAGRRARPRRRARTRYETKEAVGLAFVSGLQRMPAHAAGRAGAARRAGLPRGRGGGDAGHTEASVNSALQRARAAVEAAPPRPAGGALPTSPGNASC